MPLLDPVSLLLVNYHLSLREIIGKGGVHILHFLKVKVRAPSDWLMLAYWKNKNPGVPSFGASRIGVIGPPNMKKLESRLSIIF